MLPGPLGTLPAAGGINQSKIKFFRDLGKCLITIARSRALRCLLQRNRVGSRRNLRPYAIFNFLISGDIRPPGGHHGGPRCIIYH